MLVDAGKGYSEISGDFFVAAALGDKFQHVELSSRQRQRLYFVLWEVMHRLILNT